jgi:hypothetical protein
MDRTATFKQESISGHDPRTGFDTRTDRLTDRHRNVTQTQNALKTRVEAGSNTSTVALRVVGGDEKGTQCLEV